MKKFLIAIPVFFFVLSALSAQNAESPVPHMDMAVRVLAGDLNRKLSAGRTQKIAVGQFSYRGAITSLGQYWNNQLTEELANIPNKPYIILSGGPVADIIVSGEIVEVVDKIRVYTRLVRSDNRVIEATFHSDFERNQQINQMLYSGDSRGSSSRLPMDAWEPDSMDSPVPYETGGNDTVPVMERTIHDGDDRDFILLVPDRDAWLVMETTGNTDTCMEFYDADTGEMLADDDDGGSGCNAKIRYNAQAGRRYIAKIRGYSGSDIGHYGFHAFLQAQIDLAPDEYEQDDEPDQAKWIEPGKPQQHSFHSGDDADWVKFQITRPGRYIMGAGGLNSNDLDTYIELFDKDLNLIAEDDDGGEGYSSRLLLRLNNDLYYLKVRCLDDEPDEPYTISIEGE